jgi:putative transcriptional regulator
MNQLKHYREKSGMTRAELALSVGLKTAGAIEHYEAARRIPPLETARKLVAALNSAGAACTLDDVFPPVKLTKRRRAAA